MANGYLGKISAVVSANTADFQSKLNASARDVQAFARSVQSNLTAASRDAARSFEGIYTPLQKFERSLQAAASMKLSFKGFAGAIKDVDVLRQRLGSMKDSQISLVLKASGMKNITDVREALVGLRAKDLQIVAKVGGIEKVRELRALSAEKRVDFAINLIDSGLSRKLADARAKVQELKATVASVRDGGASPAGGVAGLASEYREATAEVKRLQEVGRQTIKTTLGVNVQKDADVDRILQAGERAEAIRLPVVLDVLGEAAVKEAVTQSQRLRSVAEQINKPFGEAVQKISAMSVEIQASFLPSMKRSQSQVESLKSSIEKGVLPASAIAQQFDVVERRVSAAVAAVNRLAEASQKISSMKTGRELAFTNPALAESLDRGVAMGNRAAGMPASAIQANPRIAAILGEYQERANQAAAAYGRLQSKIASGLPTGSAERQLEGLQGRMASLAAEFDRIYASAATDRNADRIGEMSPMDRNAGNIGARDSIRSMGERTSILDMGRSSPMDRNAGNIGARTSLGGQGARTDISDMGRMSSLEDRRRQLALQAIGATDFGSAERKVASLQATVISLQGSLEKLPKPLQAQFIPAINKVRDAFAKLGPGSSAAEIDAVTKKAAGLERAFSRAQQASRIGGTLGDALNTAAFTRVEKQIGFIRSKLLEVGAAASGPVADAFNRYSAFVADAARKGTLGLAATKEQADQLAEKIAEAAMAAGHLTAEQGKAFTKGIGDVGRMGADKLSLALNQAAFAVDDFMSSTGGLEFKLRAVSNNITQLAFILGGTKGLFIGLGAVMGGQVAVALVKHAFNTENAEKKAKILNDSLQKQRSLVDDLKSAYESLAKSIGDAGASQEQRTRNNREEQIADVRRKQREKRENEVASSSPLITKIRLDREKLEKELESPQGAFESDRDFFNRRLGLQRRIDGLKRAEASATRYFSTPITAREADAALDGVGRSDSFARINAFEDETGRTVIKDLEEIRNQAGLAGAVGPSIRAQRLRQDAIKKQLERLDQFRNDIEIAGDPTEKYQQLAEVDKEIGRLQAILSRFTDVADADFAAAEKVARELFRVADEISSARGVISEAFGSQSSASVIQADLDSLSDVIAMLTQSANDAAARGEDPSAFQQDADAARGMARELAVAANQVSLFSKELERFSAAVQQDVSSLESRAEVARRDDVSRGTKETSERRRAAEEDMAAARQAQRRFENERDTARERVEQAAMNGAGPLADDYRRKQEIDEQLASPANRIGENGVNGGTAEERESLRKERAAIQQRMDAAVEESPEMKEARRQRDAMTERAQQAEAADRGRELGMTEREKDRENAAGVAGDIAARASQLTNDADRQQFIDRATRNAYKEVAPALYDMDEQFKNAMREPSRARIEATDINSQQGQSELTRLLRGDDSAKNQNLEVLNKQLAKLEEVKQAVIANTGQVVN
jgi:hypothetical protein